MPIQTTYTYSIVNDCPGGKVNTRKLHDAIVASSIVTALNSINTRGDVMDIIFKDALSTADKTILDNNTTGPAGGLISSTDTTPSLPQAQPIQFVDSNGVMRPIPFDIDGSPRFITQKTVDTKYNCISPNWCDKTTWYEASVQAVNETLVNVDNVNFISVNAFWIDLKHGKMFAEDILLKNNPNKWISSITVDGVAKLENSPGQTDRDYSIDYANGKVIFNSAQNGVVIATYWYSPNTPGNSLWTVAPPAGQKISLLRVEIQFSIDIVLKDTSIFQAYGLADVFAPQYVPNPFPSGTIIPIGDPIRYKSMSDYIAESNGSYPIIQSFGGNDNGGWRRIPVDIITLVWDYVSRTDLKSSCGLQLKIGLLNDIPHGGTYATATFYCVQTLDN